MMDNILVENKKPEGRKNKYKYLSIGFFFLGGSFNWLITKTGKDGKGVVRWITIIFLLHNKFFFSLLDDIVFSIKLVNHLIKVNTTQLMYYFIFLPILFIYKKIDVISWIK